MFTKSLLTGGALFGAMVSLSYGQSASITNNGQGTLQMQANDVTFTTVNGQPIGTISNMAQAVTALSSQVGNLPSIPTGIDFQAMSDAVNSLTTQVTNLQPCVHTAWAPASWSECYVPAGATKGMQNQTRQVQTQAGSAATPCGEFDLVRTRPCTFNPYDTTKYCRNNEKWFNLNSGNTQVTIASSVAQDIYYYSAAWGVDQPPRLLQSVTANQALDLTPSSLSLSFFTPGDYICGSHATKPQTLAVTSFVGGQDREWVPDRVGGKVFVVPLTRNNQHIFYVQALGTAATVELDFGTVPQSIINLRPYEVKSFSGISRTGTVGIIATNNVLITQASSTSASGTPAFTGGSDWFIVTNAATAHYGIPSQGFIAATGSSAVGMKLTCGDPSGSQIWNTVTNIVNGSYWQLATANNRNPNTNPNAPNNYNKALCKAELTSPAAGQLVAGASVADADGTEATMWMPQSLLRTNFIFGLQQTKHFSLGCTGGTGNNPVSFQFTRPNQQTVTLQTAGNSDGSWYYSAGTYNPTPAGSTITVSTAGANCYLVADGRTDDEVIVWGYTA